MAKAKPAKTTQTKTAVKARAPAKASVKAKAAPKAKTAKVKAAPAKSKPDWSGAIRQALQEKQAPKTWPGGGNEAWKGAPTKKNA